MSDQVFQAATKDREKKSERSVPAEIGSPEAWGGLYGRATLSGLIYRTKMASVLRMVEEVSAPGMRVLEVGCREGHLTLALARRGLRVVALEQIKALAVATRERLRFSRCDADVMVLCESVERLDERYGKFEGVIALNAVSWRSDSKEFLMKLSARLAPNGFLIMDSVNQFSLNTMVDPLTTPLLCRNWARLRSAMERMGVARSRFHPVLPKPHSADQVRELLRDLRVKIVCEKTVGFGPLTFFGKRILPDRVGQTFQRLGQELADAGSPFVAMRGTHYLVCGRKGEE